MSEYSCIKCKRNFKSKHGLTYHTKLCDGSGIPPSVQIRIQNKNLNKIKCELCGYEITFGNFKRHFNSCNGLGPRKTHKNKTIEERSKSLSVAITLKWKDPVYRNKIITSLKGKLTGKAKTEEKEKIRREKIRKSINKRYKNGWQTKCGRAPKIIYESSIAGSVRLDGSWELKVAKYLDINKINWKRNTTDRKSVV